MWLWPPGELDTPTVTLAGSFFSMAIRSWPLLIGESPGTEKTTCSVSSWAIGTTSARPISLSPVSRLVISGSAWTAA